MMFLRKYPVSLKLAFYLKDQETFVFFLGDPLRGEVLKQPKFTKLAQKVLSTFP